MYALHIKSILTRPSVSHIPTHKPNIPLPLPLPLFRPFSSKQLTQPPRCPTIHKPAPSPITALSDLSHLSPPPPHVSQLETEIIFLPMSRKKNRREREEEKIGRGGEKEKKKKRFRSAPFQYFSRGRRRKGE